MMHGQKNIKFYWVILHRRLGVHEEKIYQKEFYFSMKTVVFSAFKASLRDFVRGDG
jgi:hypothetical protein